MPIQSPMDLSEANKLLDAWDEEKEPATPRLIQALDTVDFHDAAIEAIEKFRCPTCGARLREPCKGGVPHKRRVNKVLKMYDYRRGSVRTVSGGAPFTNRRRH